jgi:hypothetical protein
MAWNPSPKVAALRDMAAKFQWEQIVVLAVRKDHRLEGVSYGRTPALCDATKEFMDVAFEAIERQREPRP